MAAPRWSPPAWIPVPGVGQAVAVGDDGTVWAIGATPAVGGFLADRLGYAFTAYGRQIIAGHLAELAAGPFGTWAVKVDGQMLRTV